MKLVLEHEKKNKLYSVAKEAAKFHQELGIKQREHKETDSVLRKAKKVKDLVKKTRKGTDTNSVGTETVARSVPGKSGGTRH